LGIYSSFIKSAMIFRTLASLRKGVMFR
jgi:hypothetical protein